jgi:hypothetical protein
VTVNVKNQLAMTEEEKGAVRLESRRRVFHEIVDNRRFYVQQRYGNDAAERYHALKSEERFFELYGCLPSNPNRDGWRDAQGVQAEVDAHHREYFEFCDANYAMQRAMWEDRIERNRRNAMAQPLYQQQQRDRDELAAYIAEQAKNRKP